VVQQADSFLGEMLMENRDTKTSLVLHIGNMLASERRRDIERAIGEKRGVHTAWFNSLRPHLMIVKYDTAHITSEEIIKCIFRQSVQAERVA
jgi:hypothetical protein